jgi:putative MATE family efflux protein
LKDLTQGSVTKHLLRMTAFLMGSMIFQSLYFLADMYWVGRLGKESVAAVGLAANIMLLVVAATQALGIGATTLISQAVGEKDQPQANRVFHQGVMLSLLSAAIFLTLAYLLHAPYCRWLAADRLTAELGIRYLAWFIPALALQFPLISVGAALRGAGVVRPTVIILIMSVVLNLVLAPVLIFGWGTGRPIGIAGAAIASLLAVSSGTLMLAAYFGFGKRYLSFHGRDWRPAAAVWRKILAIGLPSGAELALLAVYLLLVYVLIRPFGAAAQGGFAIGARVNQSLVLPAVAVGMANAPIVGQNVGARNWERVRQALVSASLVGLSMMVVVTILCQLWPQSLVWPFSKQEEVVQVGTSYLRAISLTYVATAIIFSTASVFQGLGNTRPPFLSSTLRVLAFAIPVVLLSRTSLFRLDYVWYISAASIGLQAIMNALFLRGEMRRRMAALAPEQNEVVEPWHGGAAPKEEW